MDWTGLRTNLGTQSQIIYRARAQSKRLANHSACLVGPMGLNPKMATNLAELAAQPSYR